MLFFNAIFFICFLILCCLSNLQSSTSTEEKKIAFLFLTRGHIPLEPIWREFFRFRVRPEEYSIYVHPSKGFHFRNTSFFYGREINRTVETVYLKSTVQEAERELLKAALADPLNQHFCLISESCIPLHPFQAMKHALFSAGGYHTDTDTDMILRISSMQQLVSHLYHTSSS